MNGLPGATDPSKHRSSEHIAEPENGTPLKD
jgi:hypothetical protein